LCTSWRKPAKGLAQVTGTAETHFTFKPFVSLRKNKRKMIEDDDLNDETFGEDGLRHFGVVLTISSNLGANKP
jgi:hypothetical protein